MTSSTYAATSRHNSRHTLRRLFTLFLLLGSVATLLVPLAAAWH